MTSQGLKYRQRDHVITRRIADETLLVPISGKLADLQRIFVLDPVAEHIWEQLDGHRSVEAIAAGISEHFDADAAEASDDCRAFVGELLEAGLAEEAS